MTQKRRFFGRITPCPSCHHEVTYSWLSGISGPHLHFYANDNNDDSALDQNWGNTATNVITARVPAGTTIYQGLAASQRGLVGDGVQIYIPQVNASWIIGK